MDWLFDRRTGCWSVQTSMKIEDYIALVRNAHQAQGALSGQRNVLTTTSAKRIRARMVSDIEQGAVLPPVVIGCVLDDDAYASVREDPDAGVENLLPPPNERTLSIIDGMQRTSAIMEALDSSPSVAQQKVRVEFWLANNVRAMIYRMLVLNTGQVPWTVNRQLTVVFAPLLEEITKSVPEIEKLYSPDRPGRRVGAAQYSTDALVELYIAFSLRKVAVDTREAVSDEFSRLDFVDNLSDAKFQDQFYSAVSMLVALDKAFSRFEDGDSEKYSKGRHLFDGQPARIGFIVAVGMAVLGRPGADKAPEERQATMESLAAAADRMIEKLAAMERDQLGDYLRLDVLREVLDRRVGQVGRYERAVFAEAFKVMIEFEFDLNNLEVCWRANG